MWLGGQPPLQEQPSFRSLGKRPDPSISRRPRPPDDCDVAKLPASSHDFQHLPASASVCQLLPALAQQPTRLLHGNLGTEPKDSKRIQNPTAEEDKSIQAAVAHLTASSSPLNFQTHQRNRNPSKTHHFPTCTILHRCLKRTITTNYLPLPPPFDTHLFRFFFPLPLVHHEFKNGIHGQGQEGVGRRHGSG